MTFADTSRRKLDLGRVFGDTFGVIRRQHVPLLAITAVGSLFSLVATYLSRRLLSGGAAPTGMAALAMAAHPTYWILNLVAWLFSAFILACQLQIAIGDLENHRLPMADILRRSASKTLPICGAMLLMVMGMIFGTFLLIVPGVILGLMWMVALPVIVTDTSNPLRALGRSRALTRGNRWRILGLTILAWVVLVMIEAIVLGAVGGMTGGFYRTGETPNIWMLVLISLSTFVLYVVASAGSAALYVQLRDLKGGGGEHVAQVFA